MRDKLCLSNMIINSLTLHMSLMKGLCKNNKKLKEINDAKKKKKIPVIESSLSTDNSAPLSGETVLLDSGSVSYTIQLSQTEMSIKCIK